MFPLIYRRTSSVQAGRVSEHKTTDSETREAFIPYQRDDLIQMCLNEGLLSEAQSKDFKDLSEILMAHLHFEFLQYGEAVTLIDLRTTVDLDDFHGVLCFARGDIDKKRRESWDQGKPQSFSIVSGGAPPVFDFSFR